MKPEQDPTNKIQRFIGKELILWFFATIIGVVAATYSTYVVGGIAHLSPIKLYSAVSAIGLLSLTWGSWAALLWTRRPTVRKLIGFNTQTPAIWMIVLGGLIYWGGQLTLPIVLMLIGGGVGLVFVSRVLSRSVRKLDTVKSGLSALLLSVVHPLFTSFAVAGFLFLWIGQVVPEPGQASLAGSFFDIIFSAPDYTKIIAHLTWKSVLAVSIVSTVIPAFVSELFSRMLIVKER